MSICPKKLSKSLYADSLELLRQTGRDHSPNDTRTYIRETFLGMPDSILQIAAHLQDETATILAALLVIRVHSEETASIFDAQEVQQVLLMSKLNAPQKLTTLYSGLMAAATHFRNQDPSKGPDPVVTMLEQQPETHVAKHIRNSEDLLRTLAFYVLAKREERPRPYSHRKRPRSIFDPSARIIDSTLRRSPSTHRLTVSSAITTAELRVGKLPRAHTFATLQSTVEHFSKVLSGLDAISIPRITSFPEFEALFGIHPSTLKQIIRSKGWGVSISDLMHRATELHSHRFVATPQDYRECQTSEHLVQLLAYLLTTHLARDPHKKFYRTRYFREIFGVSPSFITRLAQKREWKISLSQIISDIETATGLAPEKPPPFSTLKEVVTMFSQAILSCPNYSRPPSRDSKGFMAIFDINPRTLQSRINTLEWPTTITQLVSQAEKQAGHDRLA